MVSSISTCIGSIQLIIVRVGCFRYVADLLDDGFLSHEQNLTLASVLRGYLLLGISHAWLWLVSPWLFFSYLRLLLLRILGVDLKRQTGREDLQVALTIAQSRADSLRHRRKATQMAARQTAIAASARISLLESHLAESAQMSATAQQVAEARIDDLEERLADAAQEAVAAQRASADRIDEMAARVQELTVEKRIADSESRAALGEVQLTLDRERAARMDAECQVAVEVSARLNVERQLADERMQAQRRIEESNARIQMMAHQHHHDRYKCKFAFTKYVVIQLVILLMTKAYLVRYWVMARPCFWRGLIVKLRLEREPRIWPWLLLKRNMQHLFEKKRILCGPNGFGGWNHGFV